MKKKSIFVFEWFTGGGLKSAGQNHPLCREGLAMLRAVVEDIVALDQWKVHCLLIDELKTEFEPEIEILELETSRGLSTQLNEIAGIVDCVWLIAPETDKALTNCLKWTIRHRHKLVSPGLDFVKLTANKFHTLRLLEENGVPTIPGSVFGKHQGGEIDFQFPVVIKPIDGAGSQNTFFVEEPAGLGSIGGKSQWLLQPFVAGTAASVSVLSGKSSVLLPPARQIFDSWPIGEFVRAEFNLNSNQMDRAIALAEKCIDCLPPTTGFFGIDLILGENTDGSDDVVCEINPRLTTSYIGLREHLPFNLAATILADAPAAKDDQADSAMSNSTKAASLARSARLSTIKYSSLE